MSRSRLCAALAACVLVAAAPASADPPSAGGGLPPYFPVGELPLPSVPGKEIADNVASFTQSYFLRVTGTPQELAAATFLRDYAADLGYQAEIQELPLAAGLPPAITHAVVATKRGTTRPDEYIVFSAHYDQVPQTIYGSYDNGTGVNMLRALAKSFARIPTNRTLVFAWYNGEEEGTLASDPHAQSFVDANRKVRALLGFDMVGIAWPVANPGDTNCLCMWHGEEDERFADLLGYVNFDVLGFPNAPNLVEVRGQNSRNSDEATWDRRFYPTLRWAGMKTAADYPAYHLPTDTMDTIDEVAGGRTYFEQGLRNTLLSSYYTALALDNEPPAVTAAVTKRAGRKVSFHASASDLDAAPGAITWSFGDGGKATGADVTHAYRRNGTFTAVAAAADNLWSQVTATAKVKVRVAAKKRARR
jgi:Peptidase family M28/PKD domain